MAKPPSTASTTSTVATRTLRRSSRVWGRRSSACEACVLGQSRKKAAPMRGFFIPSTGSAHRIQAQVHLVLAILALQDPRRYRQAIDDPDDGLLVAIRARHLGGLLRLATDRDGFLAGDLVAHRLGAAVVDHAVAQRFASS